MSKYINAEKLSAQIEKSFPDSSDERIVEGFEYALDKVKAIIDSLQQEQPDDVCSVIKEYYGKELPFEDERTKVANHFFSAGRAFELKKIEEERVKHITDLLDNYQKGKKAGYKEAISELKEGKIECSPVMKELIDKLFGIGNAFNFGFGPKDFSQEQPEVDLKEEIASFFSKNPIPHEHITDWPLLKNTAIHFYELGKLNARKEENK